MIKDTAKKLLPCVNDPKHNEALTQYANERIDSLTRNLYRETDHCNCLLYTSPSPRDLSTSRMPSSA